VAVFSLNNAVPGTFCADVVPGAFCAEAAVSWPPPVTSRLEALLPHPAERRPEHQLLGGRHIRGLALPQRPAPGPFFTDDAVFWPPMVAAGAPGDGVVQNRPIMAGALPPAPPGVIAFAPPGPFPAPPVDALIRPMTSLENSPCDDSVLEGHISSRREVRGARASRIAQRRRHDDDGQVLPARRGRCSIGRSDRKERANGLLIA
jgi:hypothetical protein